MATDSPTAADVEAASRGDVEAFTRIVRVMQGRLWRYLVLIVRDHALAEDLSQEVLVRVFRRLHTLEDPARFVPWLLTVARNAAFDAGRASKRRPITLVDDRDIPHAQHDPHIALEVHDMLDRLDDSLKDALVLVSVIGLSYAEAAEALSLPEGTVKSRVFRARRQLLEMLDDKGHHDD